MSDQRDELDRLLDEGLASYANVKPRVGIEQRVLRHVRTANAPRRRMWWPWALVIPVLASLWMLSVIRQPLPPAPVAVAPRIIPAPVMARVVPQAPAPRPVIVRPRPSGLTAQERALLTLVTRYPEEVQILAAETKPISIDPIEIPKIQIAPLNGDEQ